MKAMIALILFGIFGSHTFAQVEPSGEAIFGLSSSAASAAQLQDLLSVAKARIKTFNDFEGMIYHTTQETNQLIADLKKMLLRSENNSPEKRMTLTNTLNALTRIMEDQFVEAENKNEKLAIPGLLPLNVI